jgi:Bax protein
MNRQHKSGWQTMSRFDQAALALTGLLVAGLYGLVATDSLSSKPQKKATELVVPSQELRSDFRSDAGASDPSVVNPSESASSSMARATVSVADVALIKPVAVYAQRPSIKLHKIFAAIGYRLQDVRRHGEVPRVFIRTLPVDLGQIRQADERKRTFIKLALPLILHANDLIRQDRERIASLHLRTQQDEFISIGDKAWLADKMTQYGVNSLDYEELLRRVDVIPPSLALAQSAEESGWGTSRFAREGNALFGQRMWREGDGMVPEKRAEGETFRVRVFERLIDGVKSYAANLNTHFAYDGFRKARAAMRQSGEQLNGANLAPALRQYSERGDDYIKTIHAIIRVNELTEYDAVRLRDDLPAQGEAPET